MVFLLYDHAASPSDISDGTNKRVRFDCQHTHRVTCLDVVVPTGADRAALTCGSSYSLQVSIAERA